MASIRGKRTNQRQPKEGTQLRKAFDLFRANPGKPVHLYEIAGYPRSGTIITQLTDFYGLDIKQVKRGYYMLIGEWFGSIYMDYLANMIDKKAE